MIRVLYFLNSRVCDEEEEHVLTLLKGLDREIFIPTLVCPQGLIDRIHEILKEYKVQSYPIEIRKWTHFSEIKEFLILLRKIRPDIVHSHRFKALSFAAPISKYEKIPVVFDTVHMRETWNNENEKPSFFDKLIYKNVDHFIVVADSLKTYLTQTKELPAEKISVIKNGVDLEKYNFKISIDSADSASAKNQSKNVSSYDQKIMNLSDEECARSDKKLSIGVLGRMEEHKGHKYFLEAISKLGEKKNEAIFLLVGDGKFQLPLKEIADHLNISDNTHFLGYKKYIMEVLDSLDIVVFPSISEGLPVVALQASATGKGIIVTDVGGLPEVIVPNKTGLLVPARNSEALKNAMVKLMDNPELRMKLGKNAYEHMVKNFDVKKQIRETEEAYKLAVKK